MYGGLYRIASLLAGAHNVDIVANHDEDPTKRKVKRQKHVALVGNHSLVVLDVVADDHKDLECLS